MNQIPTLAATFSATLVSNYDDTATIYFNLIGKNQTMRGRAADTKPFGCSLYIEPRVLKRGKNCLPLCVHHCSFYSPQRHKIASTALGGTALIDRFYMNDECYDQTAVVKASEAGWYGSSTANKG